MKFGIVMPEFKRDDLAAQGVARARLVVTIGEGTAARTVIENIPVQLLPNLSHAKYTQPGFTGSEGTVVDVSLNFASALGNHGPASRTKFNLAREDANLPTPGRIYPVVEND